jgi:molybdopterin-binding protein
MVSATELSRLLSERRDHQTPITAQSARNRFPGVVTAVNRDRLVATVEIQAGPHRVVALTTREAVDELKLQPGMAAVAAVKATNVVIELPANAAARRRFDAPP